MVKNSLDQTDTRGRGRGQAETAGVKDGEGIDYPLNPSLASLISITESLHLESHYFFSIVLSLYLMSSHPSNVLMENTLFLQ